MVRQESPTSAWGSEAPRTPEALHTWAVQAAARRAEADPRVSDAGRAVDTAAAEQTTTRQRHQRESMALLVSEYGAEQARRAQSGTGAVNPRRNGNDARRRAALILAEADKLRSLPVNAAAQRIEDQHAEQEHARQQAAARGRQLDPFEHEPHRPQPDRDGPARGL